MRRVLLLALTLLTGCAVVPIERCPEGMQPHRVGGDRIEYLCFKPRED